MSRVIALACFAFAASSSPLALAQGRSDGPARDQHYEFEADALEGIGLEERGDRLRVRRGAGRVTLIRPRTHFIVELTRAVENL